MVVLKFDPLLGIERSQIVEQDLVARLFRLFVVDRFNLEQCEVPLTLLGRSNQTRDDIAGAQVKFRIWLGEM